MSILCKIYVIGREEYVPANSAVEKNMYLLIVRFIFLREAERQDYRELRMWQSHARSLHRTKYMPLTFFPIVHAYLHILIINSRTKSSQLSPLNITYCITKIIRPEQRNKWWPLEVPPLKKECTAAKRLPRARPLREGQSPSSLSSSMLCSSSLITFQYLPGQSRGCHTVERSGYSMRTHSWRRSSRCSSIRQRSDLSIDSCIYGDSVGE